MDGNKQEQGSGNEFSKYACFDGSFEYEIGQSFRETIEGLSQTVKELSQTVQSVSKAKTSHRLPVAQSSDGHLVALGFHR